MALPLSVSGKLRDDISLTAVTIPSFATSDMENSSIFRVASTRLRATYLYKDMFIGTLGLRLPTGTNQFTGEQLSTAGNLATRQLGMQYSYLFNSLDINLGASTSLGFKDIGPGDLSVGFGLSYLYKGSYTPSDESDASFSPGNEFNIIAATEYVFVAWDRKIDAMLDLGLTVYGADVVSDSIEIDAGSKFNWALSASTEYLPDLTGSVRIANYKKGAIKHAKLGETSKESSDLILALKSTLPLKMLAEYQPYGTATFGFYDGGGAKGYGSAFVFTLGGGGSKRLSERLFVDGEFGLDMGSLEEMGLFATELSGGLNYKF
jgi:hypothetical protein